MKNWIGEQIGYLFVLDKTEERTKHGSVIWLVVCICGNLNLKSSNDLKRSSGVNGCGCLAAPTYKHGKAKTSEYYTWNSMIRRCYIKTEKQYKNYGARGITVCDEWKKDFLSFYADMGKKPSKTHTLDRIDNNKGYYKENCRWTSWKIQQNNRSNNFRISFKEKTLTLQQWSEKTGIPKSTIWNRIKVLNWSIKKSLTT